MNNKLILKKSLSVTLAMVLIIASLPAGIVLSIKSFAAETVTIDVSTDMPIEITDSSKDYVITGTNDAYNSSTNPISINLGSIDSAVNITLDDLMLQSIYSGKNYDSTPSDPITLFNIVSGNVNLTLNGTNQLISSQDGYGASIAMPSASTLTIDGSGNLRVQGGSLYENGSNAIEGGALIVNGGNITIVGGNTVEGDTGLPFTGSSIAVNGGQLTVARGALNAAPDDGLLDLNSLTVGSGGKLICKEICVPTAGTFTNNGTVESYYILCEGTLVNNLGATITTANKLSNSGSFTNFGSYSGLIESTGAFNLQGSINGDITVSSASYDNCFIESVTNIKNLSITDSSSITINNSSFESIAAGNATLNVGTDGLTATALTAGNWSLAENATSVSPSSPVHINVTNSYQAGDSVPDIIDSNYIVIDVEDTTRLKGSYKVKNGDFFYTGTSSGTYSDSIEGSFYFDVDFAYDNTKIGIKNADIISAAFVGSSFTEEFVAKEGYYFNPEENYEAVCESSSYAFPGYKNDAGTSAESVSYSVSEDGTALTVDYTFTPGIVDTLNKDRDLLTITIPDPYEKDTYNAPILDSEPFRIVGTSDEMEYRLESDASAEWIPCGNDETYVERGTYLVRYAATISSFESEATEITITGERTVTVADSDSTHLSWLETSGEAEQTLEDDVAIDDIIYKCEDGYYIPTSFTTQITNGITVAKVDSTTLSISGTPTADEIVIELPSALKKTTQSAPTVKGDTGKIIGTTTAMEYCVATSKESSSSMEATSSVTTPSTSSNEWIDCSASETILEAGTYLVRFKETEAKYASEAVEVTVLEPVIPTQTVLIQLGEGNHIVKSEESGALSQTLLEGKALTAIIIKSVDGYYFPDNYSVEVKSGITVTRVDLHTLKITGTPVSNATYDDIIISLPAASSKAGVLEATKSDCTITGTLGKEDFYTSNVRITAKEGYQISLLADSDFKDSLLFTETTEAFEVYYLEVATGFTSKAVTIDGFKIDKSAPKLSGVLNNEKTFADTKVITIEDDNLASVVINGEAIEFTGNTFTYELNAEDGTKEFIIVLTDKSGNTVTYKCTLSATWMETMIIPANKSLKLEKNTEYHLSEGKWTVSGDSTVYSGGQSFYCTMNSTYIFEQAN